MDFYFILIIVTPGKWSPPVISPPPFACPGALCRVPHANVCATYIRLTRQRRESRTREPVRGLLRYYIYDAIGLRDVNDN